MPHGACKLAAFVKLSEEIIMKKIVLGLAIFSAFAAVGAQAAPTIGAHGNINFIGSINADTCVVRSPGASSSGANLLVDMGPVSPSSLGTENQPNVSGGGVASITKNLDLQIECVAGTDVQLKLIPNNTSGKGIAVTGGAQNVQIMLVNNQTALDFSTGSFTLEAPFENGAVTIPLAAYYTLKSGTTKADVVPGQANATVAYELSYE